MADIIDNAQEYNELYQEVAINNQRALAKPGTHESFDGVHCVECEIEIPEARLKLQYFRCVDCQSDLETFQRQYSYYPR